MGKHGNSHRRSGSKDLPPIRDALSSDEELDSYSHSRRSVGRHQSSRLDTLEPPASTSYSSSSAGFDYYAKNRQARGTTDHSSYGGTGGGYYGDASASSQGNYGASQYSSSSAQGANEFNVGYQRRQVRSRKESAPIERAPDSNAGRQRAPAGRGKTHHSHQSRSSCKDPSDKGKSRDDYGSDDEYDDAPRSRTYGGTSSSGGYYGSSSAAGYYGSAY
ncbi:hypothetical protein PG984_012964 [Apiospora sp. TS-2023a]